MVVPRNLGRKMTGIIETVDGRWYTVIDKPAIRIDITESIKKIMDECRESILYSMQFPPSLNRVGADSVRLTVDELNGRIERYTQILDIVRCDIHKGATG